MAAPRLEAERTITIAGEPGIVVARQQARDYARALGFGVLDQSRIATAVSELTRNIVRYAIGARGEVVLRSITRDNNRTGIEIVVRDEGPGIPDLKLAMHEGFTSGAGLGMGLPGTRRLVDEMEIDTGPGCPTIVTIRKWLR